MLGACTETATMKPTRVLSAVALALAFALPAMAQQSTSQPKLTPLPPPPSINDPGVKEGAKDTSGQAPIPRPVPYDSTEGQTSTPATSDAQPMQHAVPTLPAMQDNSGSAMDSRGKNPPQVTVRQQDGDTVEEYRSGGRLYMVRVTPKNGPPQTYMADPSGKLYHDAADGPVNPVYYKVYEWGDAPKPASQQGQ
jgi:hypothetical protein